MTNEWRRKNHDSDLSDKQTAATLAAALIAERFTLPTADNPVAAVEQAVDLYRMVLNKLNSPEVNGKRDYVQDHTVSAAEQEEMDTLGVTRVDSAKFCYGEYRYDNLSDALRYALAKSRTT